MSQKQLAAMLGHCYSCSPSFVCYSGVLLLLFIIFLFLLKWIAILVIIVICELRGY